MFSSDWSKNVASKVKAWTSANEGDKISFTLRPQEKPDNDDTQQNELSEDENDDGKEEPVYLTRHTKGHDGKA